jgi:hypothetical protein
MFCKNRKSSRQNRKRSVLFVLAIAFQLSALAVLATPSEAFAQLPGEWGNYIPENDGGLNLSMTGPSAKPETADTCLGRGEALIIKCGWRSITAMPSRLV